MLQKGNQPRDGERNAPPQPSSDLWSRLSCLLFAGMKGLAAQGNTVRGLMAASSCFAATPIPALQHPCRFAPFPPAQPAPAISASERRHGMALAKEIAVRAVQDLNNVPYCSVGCTLTKDACCHAIEMGQEQGKQRAQSSMHLVGRWVNSPQMLSKCRDGYCIKQSKEEQT